MTTAASLTDAKSDLALLFGTADGVPNSTFTKVTRVYKGEPRDLVKAVVLTVATEAVTINQYGLRVRIYAPADTDIAGAEANIDLSIEEAETILDTSAEFERGEWTVAYDPEIVALVATTVAYCQRPT